MFDPDLLLFTGICLLVGSSYYLYGIFVADFLGDNFQASFLPYLYFKRTYWKGSLLAAVSAVGYTPLIAALMGIPFLPKGFPRVLLGGLFVGYLIFGLVYTYPFDTVAQCHLYEVVGIAVRHSNVYCYTKTVRPSISPRGDFTSLHGVVSAAVARRDNHRPSEVLSYGV